ncbi:hypothetical protein ACFT5B_03810 [Luteimicrobium sp. NPDC057192]|uniref:hypothetical protein n=1 Tax=Luteimicrobium sp. NPDC057192 TaxID=3346042 RepID=UPI00363D98DD
MTDDDAQFVVVRGGLNRDAAYMTQTLIDETSGGDQPCLSVFALLPIGAESEDEVVGRVCREAGIPHGKVQRSTGARLRAAGFSLVHEVGVGEADCHYHVYFETPVTEAQMRRFIESFDPPEPNPTGGMRRRS